MSERSYGVLDRPEVLSILFYPRRDVGAGVSAVGVHPVLIEVASGVAVGGRIYAAGNNDPMILYFHGNGEIASDYDSIAPLYNRLGVTLFVVDYRGYGSSDGAPTATALIADARVCHRLARETAKSAAGLEPGKVFVMGRSLGSAAALEIAQVAGTSGDIDGIIIESGFAYTFPLIERIGYLQIADAYEHKDGFGNLEKMAEIRVPTLIIHGERDWIIPVGDAEALFEACPASDKRFVRVAGAGHNDLMLVGRRPYFEAISLFCGGGPLAMAATEGGAV
ncbi:MAG: alpha/beta fold hydrolase [Rhodospirillales bacterium]